MLRPKGQEPEPALGGSGRAPCLPLQAMEDGAGAVIRMRGPQLPNIVLQR